MVKCASLAIANVVLLFVVVQLVMVVVLPKLSHVRVVKPMEQQQHHTQNRQHQQHQQLRRINIPTQGEVHYTQLGILHDGTTVLPLMGRPTYPRSHMWNYYTLTNDAVSLRVPLITNGRHCDSSTGCKELFEGDSVIIPEFGSSSFRVKMYDKAPRYIPYI